MKDLYQTSKTGNKTIATSKKYFVFKQLLYKDFYHLFTKILVLIGKNSANFSVSQNCTNCHTKFIKKWPLIAP